MNLSPGTRLGPYEIVAPVAAGGMGEVYRATDTRLGRTVAIKVSRDEFSERFEREARAVAVLNHPVEALKVTLLGGEKPAVLKRSTENPEAYDLCLKARHAWTRWTDEDFRTAISLFERALQTDPNYALAHFGLGDCRVAWEFMGREPINLPRMRTHLETALRLDPELAEAHAVLGGVVEGLYAWNWSRAESQCRKGVALNPRSAHVHMVSSMLSCLMGRADDGVASAQRSVQLDPLGPFWHVGLLQSLTAKRDWDAVLRDVQTTLQLAPGYWFAELFAGMASAASGRLDEAIAAFERCATASLDVPFVIGHLGGALARAGRRDEAQQQLDRLRDHAATHHVPAVALACVHAGLDQRDEAFTLLNRACDAHDPWLSYLLTFFPTLDNLRPDPRFLALRRRIGLT